MLGQVTGYPSVYSPSLLQAISREAAREGILPEAESLPFTGVDIWNAYELSWLNSAGKPEIAVAELQFPCTSPTLIESKSLKLYLNSFSETRFGSPIEVRQTLESDLSVNAEAPVQVKVTAPDQASSLQPGIAPGECLDELAIKVDCYEPTPALLTVDLDHTVSETLHTNLFRSVCPVTEQPDWGTIIVSYKGQAINHVGLLRYLVSYRRHAGFHEQCVEKIFMDILQSSAPESLSVHGRFLRRGGLEINPFRSTDSANVSNTRLLRQ